MISHILVPTDFSSCALNAVKYAAQLAKDIQATQLHVVHAFSMPMSYADSVMVAPTEAVMNKQKEDIEKSFDLLKTEVPTLEEIDVKYESIQELAVDGITDYCNSNSINLIVMGTKGASGIEEIVMGTVAHAVIQASDIPVLVIPQGGTYKRNQHMALASDLKDLDVNILEPLKLFQRTFGGHISIVHIDEEQTIKSEDINQAKKLDRYFKNFQHNYQYLVSDNTSATLEEYIKNKEIDLLAVIPRKHSFFERIFKKSESKELIYHTDIPLLAIPE